MNKDKEKTVLLKMIENVNFIMEHKGLEYMLSYGSLIGAVREKGFIPWDNEIDIWVKKDIYDSFIDTLRTHLSDDYKVLTYEDDGYELYFSRIITNGSNHHTQHIDIFPLVGAPKDSKQCVKFVNKSFILNKAIYIKKQNPYSLYFENKRYLRYFQSILAKIVLILIPQKLILKELNNLALKYNPSETGKVYTFGGSYKTREVFDYELFQDLEKVDFENLKLPIPKRYHEILTQVYGDYMTSKKTNYLS